MQFFQTQLSKVLSPSHVKKKNTKKGHKEAKEKKNSKEEGCHLTMG